MQFSLCLLHASSGQEWSVVKPQKYFERNAGGDDTSPLNEIFQDDENRSGESRSRRSVVDLGLQSTSFFMVFLTCMIPLYHSEEMDQHMSGKAQK